MHLTEKEKDIIELIGEGKTNKYIAEKMNYTIPGIKKRVGILLRKKFKVENRTALYKSYMAIKQSLPDF
jgi:DNA-binding NarL/FixJ family response regulator